MLGSLIHPFRHRPVEYVWKALFLEPGGQGSEYGSCRCPKTDFRRTTEASRHVCYRQSLRGVLQEAWQSHQHGSDRLIDPEVVSQ